MGEYLAPETIGENERVEIRRELRVLWFFWTGCMGMPFAMFFMCEVFGQRIRENLNRGPDFPINKLTYLFLIVGLASSVLSYFLRKWLLSGIWEVFNRQAERAAVSLNKPVYMLKYRQAIFIPTALSSTPAIYGFLLFMLGADKFVLYFFLGIAFLGVLYHRPKEDELIEMLRREKSTTDIVEDA